MLKWREFGDALGGRDRASVEMYSEAMIERVWGYALGGLDCSNLEAVIK
jgi:hypothetical protein